MNSPPRHDRPVYYRIVRERCQVAVGVLGTLIVGDCAPLRVHSYLLASLALMLFGALHALWLRFIKGTLLMVGYSTAMVLS